jgi:hypothetical protein
MVRLDIVPAFPFFRRVDSTSYSATSPVLDAAITFALLAAICRATLSRGVAYLSDCLTLRRKERGKREAQPQIEGLFDLRAAHNYLGNSDQL